MIDPRDEGCIAEWNIDELRHRVYDICESSADVILPEGIRATMRFLSPTPFDLKTAQLGQEALAKVYVSPLPDEPDVQVVTRWRYQVATLAEVFSLRRLLPRLQQWRTLQIVERAGSSPNWVIGICHPARACELVGEAERVGLQAVIEPFVPSVDETPEQIGTRWGCEVPARWWPR